MSLSNYKASNGIEFRWNDKDLVVIDQACKDGSHRVIIVPKADVIAAADAIKSPPKRALREKEGKEVSLRVPRSQPIEGRGRESLLPIRVRRGWLQGCSMWFGMLSRLGS